MPRLSLRGACGSVVLLTVALAASVLEAQPYGLPGPRENSAAYLNMPQTPPQPSGNWRTEVAFPGLEFSNPVWMGPAPRSNRLYVCEREGKIWSFQNDRGATQKTLVLDIMSRTQGWDDCGLMSAAFHPEFGLAGSASRGYFFVYYQYNPTPVPGPNRPPTETPTFNRVARFTIPDGQFTADPASELVLVTQHDRNVWHGGGTMLFHPADGFLYFAIGDEGNANDSYNVTQRINDKFFGGVFRIDVDMKGGAVSHPIRRQPQSYPGRPSSSANYFIPNDNPFLDASGAVLEEFFALGVRSPHRLTYDPVRGVLLLGDVGQGAYEEIDIIEKGKNYGWPYREGNHAGPQPRPSTVIGVEAPALYDYGRGEGSCIIGGYIYRGSEHAASLGGKYVFGDNTNGRMWALNLDTTPPAVEYLTNMPAGSNYTGLSSFGIDASNELYMLKMNHTGPGQIYKLARDGTAGPPLPARLSLTGAFTDLAALATAPGLEPYDVGSPLWSDGAHKIRWMSIPTGAQIIFSPTGEWTFPSGTVFVKHFELTVNEITNARRRLETRLLVRSPGDGVYGVTYRWRPDGSEADLLTEGLDEVIPIVTATGSRAQTWRYPSSVQCLTCHNPTANHVLGVKTRQLNTDVLYSESGVVDNQIRSLNHIGYFNPPVNEAAIPGYSSLAPVSDTTSSLEHRVRSYVDANCALCHRPGGVQAFFDARFDTPLDEQGLIDGFVSNGLGIDMAAVVRPRDRWRSILHVRASSTAVGTRMPPLARNVPDAEALSVIEQWIDGLSGTPALAPPGIDPPGGSFEDSVLVTLDHPDGSATIRYTLDGMNPTEVSSSYTGPITLTDSATVSAKAFRAGYVESVLARSDFTNALAGLYAEYFDNIDFTSLVVTRVDPTVDFDWGSGSPDPVIGANSFSVRWTGQVEALFNETYTFYTVSDDGVRLWIDDNLIIDNWTDHAPFEDIASIPLEAGRRHDLRMEMNENGGGAVARLLWSSPSTPKEVIPQRRLFSTTRPSIPDVTGLACARAGSDVTLAWTNGGAYDEIRVYQNGVLEITLPGTEDAALLALDPRRTINTFRVASVVGGDERGGQSCDVLALGGTYATVIDEDFAPVPPPSVLDLNCSAAVRNGGLELTEPALEQVGTAFFLDSQQDDEIIAEFDFTFSEPSDPGADGLAFIINRGGATDVCGAAGGAMGFRATEAGGSVFPGFAVIFDTWLNAGEVSHNWVGIVDAAKGGAAQAAADIPEEFCGNGTFHARVVASRGTFVVLLSNPSIGMAEREVLSHTVAGFVPGQAFYGFSAGTGGAFARHRVDNFRLRVLTVPPPVASFTGAPLEGEAPLRVQFTSTSQGDIGSYSWNFGDGSTSALRNPDHIYNAPGFYSVSLRVTGPGGSNTQVRGNYVHAIPPEGPFIRGDSNGSGGIEISDAIFTLLHAFTGTVSTNCPDALDADDNGSLEITDALRVLLFLFQGGPAPEAPFPTAGLDGTADGLADCGRGL